MDSKNTSNNSSQCSRKCTCTQCGFEKTRLVENSALHDDIELIWKSDETGHWFECSCGRQVEFEEHTYGDWSEKTPAGVDQDRQLSRKCSECEYEDIITFNGTKTNGKYCMSINEVIKISDSEKVVKVKILRGTIITGDNVSVDGISGTFSINKITKNRIEVTNASCGEEVELTLGAEGSNLDDLSNRKSGYLMYEPDTIKSYKTFTAQIHLLERDDANNVGRNSPIMNNTTFDKIVFNEKMGIRGTITFSNSNDMIKSGETQIVTITFTSKVAILEGMDFIINEIRDSVTWKIVEGTILTVVSEE